MARRQEVIAASTPSALPAALANKFAESGMDKLVSGGSGFPVLSIKGSKWRMKLNGEENMIRNENDEPVPSIEIVIVDMCEGLTKNYYPDAYKEGDDGAPVCHSINGVTPEADSEEPQSASCATCPHNVWGSKITPTGSKTKACSDSKLIAVIFVSDLFSDKDPQPMMMKVPPASLKDLSTFARGMKDKGFIPQQISIRVGFTEAAFPQLTFKAIRPLSEAEVGVIGDVYDYDATKEIVGKQLVPQKAAVKQAPVKQAAPVKAAATVDTDFEEEAPVVIAKPVVRAKPAEKAKVVAEAPAPVKEVSSIDSDIDDILGDLDNL